MRALRALFAACLILFGGQFAVAQDKPMIVAVNHPLQFMAERLVGDGAEVVFPVPVDVDPSFWRPSVADISMIQSADLVLLNGAGFATWVDRVSLSRAKVVNTTSVVEDQFIVTESITHSHGEGDTHSHEGLASYTWLDPTLALAQAEAIAAAIQRRDLAPAEDVTAQLAQLRADLEELDATTKGALGNLQDVAMIATHPRYQYFARRYGLEIASLEWEAGAMPTSDELADLEARVQETGAQVILWEAEPPQAAQDAASALGLRNVVFSPMAKPAEGQGFIDAFSGAVQNLADAASGG